VKRLVLILFVFILIYIGSYAFFRSPHIERWNQNGRDYIIFPESGMSIIPIGR